jgi:hypothetical protein
MTSTQTNNSISHGSNSISYSSYNINMNRGNSSNSISNNSNRMYRKVYQVRAFYTDDNDEERAYVTDYFDNVYDAHTIYQYAMLELAHNFVSVELVEYPKKDTCVIIDRETSKNISRGNKVRKSLRLILKSRQDAIEKEKMENRLLEKKKLFEKRFDNIVKTIILSRQTGGLRN